MRDDLFINFYCGAFPILLAALTVVYFKFSTRGVHTTDSRNDAHIVNNIISCCKTDTGIGDIQYINLWENCDIM